MDTEHKTMTVGELRSALAGFKDSDIVLVEGIYDGDLISVVGFDTLTAEVGVEIIGIMVQHTFPEEWFYEDEEGSRWDKLTTE